MTKLCSTCHRLALDIPRIGPPFFFAHFHRQGGANGSIRFEPEIKHGANAGLAVALGLLKPVKKRFSDIGWADLMQLASATAVEAAGEGGI